MQSYFETFRKDIIGIDQEIPSPEEGLKRIVYADWTASGRNYGPIEDAIRNEIMPFVGNTHTETSSTGTAMTYAYHRAQAIIKEHVNANIDDVIITAASGMTRLVNKLQRIIHFRFFKELPPLNERPVVFITHMEHHSNQTSWLETIATVEIIPPTQDGMVDLKAFEELLAKYQDRALKIASVTACSNVTGIETPYFEISKMIHRAGGYCFVDFACSAPYVKIDMHPAEKEARLDAIFFSPHKFLGGPGSSGVLIFNSALYDAAAPDNPGGGTVDWTNPWGEYKYVNNIEAREDGGTPAFLQTIKAAMSIKLKDRMGIENIIKREHELINRLWDIVEKAPNLHILASNMRDRLAILSFYIDGLHHNLGVRLLNDKFGIQSRGGCSCAGTYGHYLLHVDRAHSKHITDLINRGDYSLKPGWIRVSLHPTMTNEEVDYIGESVLQLARNYQKWIEKYSFDKVNDKLIHKSVVLDKELKERMDKALNFNSVKEEL